eukprot:TRINITY_DN36898_c0_g1_i2.p1 TRINITY_DN36898_c0_g1~~TRINITY_DN36898_c0_g1_i2.p1  ORF type:complete len:218 (-),score=45.16 TRINITY_DN36898_c0_g1_i2:92-745(-)
MAERLEDSIPELKRRWDNFVENGNRYDFQLFEDLDATEAEFFDYIAKRREWPPNMEDPRHDIPWRDVAFKVNKKVAMLSPLAHANDARTKKSLFSVNAEIMEGVPAGMMESRYQHLELQHLGLTAIETELAKDLHRSQAHATAERSRLSSSRGQEDDEELYFIEKELRADLRAMGMAPHGDSDASRRYNAPVHWKIGDSASSQFLSGGAPLNSIKER